MNISALEGRYIDQLAHLYDADEARSLAKIAVGHACQFNQTQYLVSKQIDLTETENFSVIKILDELKSGKPIQYVLGETEFYGLNFLVNPAVLIPRPETEELVDWILKTLKKSPTSKSQPLRILDMGTGSGCIAVSLKKNLPQAGVFGLDISKEAINTARLNAGLNNVEISFIEDDLFMPLTKEVLSGNFDLIVSNPPYVTETEKALMHVNVLNFEPHVALFVKDDEPLSYYHAIAKYATKHLCNQGRLFLEINENLSAETGRLLHEMGFVDIEIKADLRDKPRMIAAEFNKV